MSQLKQCNHLIMGRTGNIGIKSKGLEADLEGVRITVSPFLSGMTMDKSLNISLPLISSPIK